MDDSAVNDRIQPRILVIGCGNVLRGDDAVGPELVRRLRLHGLPPDTECVDGGTGGIDVAFRMRGVAEVILIDACSSGSEPGTLFEVSGDALADLPPPRGFHSHALRWDHALAWARAVVTECCPTGVTAFLVEKASCEIGAGLSPAVDHAVDRLVDHLVERLHRPAAATLSGRGIGAAAAHRGVDSGR